MDKLDFLYTNKQFFSTLFHILDNNEYIRIVVMNKGQIINQKYFNDLDELGNFIYNNMNYDIFFNIATTNGLGGSEENILNFRCIGLDIDRKDNPTLTLQDLKDKLKNNNIPYHFINDTGGGFHIFIAINKTNRMDLIKALTNKLADLIGADKNAIKLTQLLRVPNTKNTKHQHKRVNIMNFYHRNKEGFYKYDIEKLYKRFFTKEVPKTTFFNCLYVDEIIEKGSKEGNRGHDLINYIIPYLRDYKHLALNEALPIINKWAKKSNFTDKKDRLDYQIKYAYENKEHISKRECNNCKYKQECLTLNTKKEDKRKENQSKGDNVTMEVKKINKSKATKNKDKLTLKGNDLFIYSVIENANNPLTIYDILNLIYDRKRKISPLSEKVVRESVNHLIKLEFIKRNKGNSKLKILDTFEVIYKATPIEGKIKVSYFVTLAVIWGRITTQDLRLYYHLANEQHKQLLEGKVSDNYINIVQEDIEKYLGLSHPTVSNCLNSLYENHIIDREKIKLKGVKYTYKYYLNY